MCCGRVQVALPIYLRNVAIRVILFYLLYYRNVLYIFRRLVWFEHCYD